MEEERQGVEEVQSRRSTKLGKKFGRMKAVENRPPKYLCAKS